MQVTMYAAISIDGFIAKPNGDSDWVSEVDTEYFQKAIEGSDCVIVGKRTFDQYKDELYPVPIKLNIVMTSQPPNSKSYENVEFMSHEPIKVIEHLKSKGCQHVLIIGGGKTNYSFMNAGVVDNLIVDIHPIVLGDGIKLFSGAEMFREFERLSTLELPEGLVQITLRKKQNLN